MGVISHYDIEAVAKSNYQKIVNGNSLLVQVHHGAVGRDSPDRYTGASFADIFMYHKVHSKGMYNGKAF